MRRFLIGFAVFSFVVIGCKESIKSTVDGEVAADSAVQEESQEFTIVFASCNDQNREQPLWEPIIGHAPDVFIWGGDNIYADTADMQKMQADYNKVKSNKDYTRLREMTSVIGTWDDHDYGTNDGGVEWAAKAQAQDLLLDFLDVSKTDSLRSQQGVYHKQVFETPEGSVQILLLDTRSFRTGLLASEDPNRRFKAWPKGHDGTVLGAAQWQWLEQQLRDDSHDFTIILTSIQFLSGDHGYEKWGHFPDEVDKMYSTLQAAKASNIFMFSGDRHQGEILVNKEAGLPYPLVELTSSGLTHTFPGTPLETNPFRVGEGTKEINFSVIRLDFKNKKASFELRGREDYLIEQMLRQY